MSKCRLDFHRLPQRTNCPLPPSISSLFLPVPLCLYSLNESRRVQVEEPDGGTRGKGLITTFPNGASSVPKCMSVRRGMTDKGTNGDKQTVPMYQRIPTQSQSLSRSALRNSNSPSLAPPTFSCISSRCSQLGNAKKVSMLESKKGKE